MAAPSAPIEDGGVIHAQTQFIATLRIREQYREEYWRTRDPIADERLLWRAQTFRHMVHLLPGQTVLEVGCGEGRFTRQLAHVTRGENPITAVTFSAAPRSAPPAGHRVEFLRVSGFPGELQGRCFDCIVGMDLLDKRNYSPMLEALYQLLAPGGQVVFYESNPWNPFLKLRRAIARAVRRPDPRYLPNRPELYELLSAIGFLRILAVYNDFVFSPLSRSMAWTLRNLSILLENAPLLRSFAGSILVYAQKPPIGRAARPVSLAEHESLRAAVSVVIPCYNEEMNVRPLVTRLCDLFGGYLHEIIPVDDNSTDGTRVELERLAAENPIVKPLFRRPPNGVGGALREGYRAATGRYVLSMDCDFQHLLPEIRDLFDAAAAGCEVVVGSRFSRYSVLLNYPYQKIVANRAFHVLAQLVLMCRFRDMTNNLKLMKRDVVDRLHLTQQGFAVNAEVGLQPFLLGCTVTEVPISWINRMPGMGASSFRLLQVGGGYWQVLYHVWLKAWFGRGRYRGLAKSRDEAPPEAQSVFKGNVR